MECWYEHNLAKSQRLLFNNKQLHVINPRWFLLWLISADTLLYDTHFIETDCSIWTKAASNAKYVTIYYKTKCKEMTIGVADYIDIQCSKTCFHCVLCYSHVSQPQLSTSHNTLNTKLHSNIQQTVYLIVTSVSRLM